MVFLAVSVGLVVAAAGDDQLLVLFYAVAVFLSFLFGLLAMAAASWRERRWGLVVSKGSGPPGRSVARGVPQGGAPRGLCGTLAVRQPGRATASHGAGICAAV